MRTTTTEDLARATYQLATRKVERCADRNCWRERDHRHHANGKLLAPRYGSCGQDGLPTDHYGRCPRGHIS